MYIDSVELKYFKFNSWQQTIFNFTQNSWGRYSFYTWKISTRNTGKEWGKAEMEWDFSKWKQCLEWKTSFSLVSCMAAVPCWPPQIPLLLRSVSIAPPTSWLKKQKHRYLLQVKQPIKEEKQHFLTHLHHLEPHTADLPCSPSSGYICSSMKLQLWHNEKKNPTIKIVVHCKKEQCLIKDLQHLLQLCLGNNNISDIKSSVRKPGVQSRRAILPSLLLIASPLQTLCAAPILSMRCSRQYPHFTAGKTGALRWGICHGALWVSEAFQLLSCQHPAQHKRRKCW